MSVVPPEDKVWWKNPVDKGEKIWFSIAVTWAIILFLMMPAWHIVGNQNPSSETYKISPEEYDQKVQQFIDEYQVDTQNGKPVVAPPPGSDVYIKAYRYDFTPILQLEKGETYNLHLSSTDKQHGFSLYPMNMNFQILPKYEYVMTITPTEARDYRIICNEYCVPLHHTMVGKLEVTE